MSGLVITITNAGRAALINAANTGTNAVKIAKIGVSAQHFNTAPTTTSLPGEIKKLTTFSGQAVAADTIHITIRDESDAGYSLRSFGLYLEDGTLFAVYSQSAVIMQKSASSMLLLAVDIRLVQINASTITFGNANFLNPPATTSMAGVVELATNAEASAGTDNIRAMTPAATKVVLDAYVSKTALAHADISARIDSGFYTQGNPSDGWPTGATGWWNLLSSTNGTPSQYYALQFACSFHNDVVYFRSTKNNGNASWHKLWHSGNFDPDSRLKLSGGTLSGNLKIEKDGSAALLLKSTNGHLISYQTNGNGNTGIWDHDGKKWLFRIDANDKTHFAGDVQATAFLGNASTATKLKSVCQINGINFDGSANIVTPKWGAQRKLKIGNTEKTVDGSGNVTWTLSEIGAAGAVHGHSIAGVAGLQDALNGKSNIDHIHATEQVVGLDAALNNRVTKIATAPPDITARIDSGFYQQSAPSEGWPTGATSWWHLISCTHSNAENYYALQFACSFFNDNVYVRRTGNDGNRAWNTLWHSGNFDPDSRLKLTGGTLTGNVTLATAGEALIDFKPAGKRHIRMCASSANNTGFYDLTNSKWLFRIDVNEKTQFAGQVQAAAFLGNASTATKLKSVVQINGTNFDGSANIVTPKWGAQRKLKIGNAEKTVDGSGNVTWTLSEIGAAGAVHGHSIAGVAGLQDELNNRVKNIAVAPSNITARIDSGFYQQIASADGGWPGGLGVWCHLISCTYSDPNNYYALQFACSYYDDTVYVRSTSNNGNASWRKLWHSGNFDPDSRLKLTGGILSGNLTINTGTYTAALLLKAINGHLISYQTNGNGNTGIYDHNAGKWLFRIDVNEKAFFAGGVQATAFLGNASTATKLKSVVQINGTNFDGSANIVTPKWGAQRKLKIGNTEKTVDGSGNVTWTPGDIGYSASKNTNGWMKRPDGIIEQWGVYMMTTTSEITRNVTFPIAFPNGCWNVTVSDINSNSINKIGQDMYAQVNQGSLSNTGFSVFIQHPGGNSNSWTGMYWRAIGH